MAKGYGFEINPKELLLLLAVVVGFVLVLPYIIKQLFKNTISAAIEPLNTIIQPAKAAGVFVGNNVITPIVRDIGQVVAPDGWKIVIGDTTYGDFAAPPPKSAYDQALQDAKLTLYAGQGTRGADGLFYVDKVIANRTTRFILMMDGLTVAPQSLPPA